MTDATEGRTSRATALTRLAIGLTQGIVLFLLQKADESKAWPATQPMLYAPLLVCALMVPLIPLAALSAMRRTFLVGWSLAAAALAAILAVHAAWTGAAPDRIGAGPLSPPLFIAVAALLFIAHHLVQPAEAVRKPVAPYADYFDLVGTNVVRLVLSLLFTGAFWLLLFLAAALFKLIGVEAIQKLIGETAFAFPATGLMFAAAVHMAVQLTEARAGLVRGVRTVGLVLLAWLLPLMVVIAAGFLATLPFTGLAPLWGTKAATALLLAAAAALIVLINAAYQDGLEPPNPILRWAARAASLLLIPIVVLAAYALWLRIDQYGLTPDRVFATAYLVVAAGFTGGYTLAALRPGPWMKPLERTNLIMAAVAVLLLIALFTPIADPARLSVASQVRRLETGKVSPAKFDYTFLRFDAGRYGREALERLKSSRDPRVAAPAAASAKRSSPYEPPKDVPINVQNAELLAKAEVFPKGSALPASFIAFYKKPDAIEIQCTRFSACLALLRDVDGDGAPEVLLANEALVAIYREASPGTWEEYGYFHLPTGCGLDVRRAFETNDVTPHKARLPDIEIDGRRLDVTIAPLGCPDTSPSADEAAGERKKPHDLRPVSGGLFGDRF